MTVEAAPQNMSMADDQAEKIQQTIDLQRLNPIARKRRIFPFILVALGIFGLGVSQQSFATQIGEQSQTTTPRRFPELQPQLPRFSPPQETEPDPQAPNRTQLWVDPSSAQQSWETINANAYGLLTFRGNPTRSFYGTGPIGDFPKVLWSQQIGCSNSPVDGVDKTWCGTGWTGQPAIFKSPKNSENLWLAVGGYNKAVNFFDPSSGSRVFPSYETDDIIKGSVTIDPDGFPILYTGSRDNNFHVVSLDGDRPETLWKLSSETDAPTFWNNDWDSSALVIDDYLFVGGENSRFYIFKLNRGFNANGRVTVSPVEVFSAQAWDDQLLKDIADTELSVENSLAISGNTIYFSNSGGLVQGWDISQLTQGDQPQRVFRYWVGDDTDATVVVDEQGMLYVGVQYQRATARSNQTGQILKLDPSNQDDPLVWAVKANSGVLSGIWATPALYDNIVIVPTDDGEVLGIDRTTGETLWTLQIGGQLWSSPGVVDDTLIQTDCAGNIRAYDLSGAVPMPRWTVSVASETCIESTPAIWNGSIYVGARNGNFYAVSTG